MQVSLLISLLISHYIGDYTHLSTKEMLDAKRIGRPYKPIADHALVHTVIMCLVCAIFISKTNRANPATTLYIVCAIEFFSHFFIDVLKGKCNVWFPAVSQPQNKSHWYIFGFDQLLHQIAIVAIWWVICG